LIDALIAFEPEAVTQREQPVEHQRRVPLRTPR
jgi:hypothetical protein